MNFGIGDFNDFRHESCARIYEIYEERTSQDWPYEAYREMIESLREPIGIALSIDPEILESTDIFDLYLF